ncbi:MAG: prepilin-type N-terminal cleavage/methylation domain-containing protein [Planctomycetes bacterium]|nr:prepilin-type N-terminal cleavage/methylation domain-containing protein [Planctomycetota bacterium]
MTRSSRTHAAGFTLIEVLVAISITATVMLTVGTTFRVMVDARDVVDELTESTEAGPRILNLIERDLRSLWTYNIGNNAVLRGRSLDIGSFEADRIDFLCTTQAVGYVLNAQSQPRRPAVCEVGDWLKPNPRYRDLMELWRREDPMVDRDLITQGSFQLVHDRIKYFKISYFKTLGNKAEELHEWDSSADDQLPRRIRIEFQIERRRGSGNTVNAVEIDDFEDAEKKYVRHFVLDADAVDALRSSEAVIPLLPVEPEVQQGSGPAGPAGPGGPAGPAGPGSIVTKGSATTTTATRNGPGMPGGERGTGMPNAPRIPGQIPGGGLPPGLGEILRGGGGAGGLGGIFGGGAGGGRGGR